MGKVSVMCFRVIRSSLYCGRVLQEESAMEIGGFVDWRPRTNNLFNIDRCSAEVFDGETSLVLLLSIMMVYRHLFNGSGFKICRQKFKRRFT